MFFSPRLIANLHLYSFPTRRSSDLALLILNCPLLVSVPLFWLNTWLPPLTVSVWLAAMVNVPVLTEVHSARLRSHWALVWTVPALESSRLRLRLPPEPLLTLIVPVT